MAAPASPPADVPAAYHPRPTEPPVPPRAAAPDPLQALASVIPTLQLNLPGNGFGSNGTLVENAVRIAQTDPPISGLMSLSPDGKQVAFSFGGGVYVRALPDGPALPAASGSGATGTPFWSADGRSLAFARQGMLYTVPARGGEPAKAIVEVNTNLPGTWGPDGTILIGIVGDGLLAVPSSGGPSHKITTVDPLSGETRHLLPQFLPGGRQFLYTAGSDKPGENAVYVAALDGTLRKQVLRADSPASFVSTGGTKGYLLFGRSGRLMAQAFSMKALETVGEAFPVTGPLASTVAAKATSLQIPQFSATAKALVFRTIGSPKKQVVRTATAGDRVNMPGGTGVYFAQNWLVPPARR